MKLSPVTINALHTGLLPLSKKFQEIICPQLVECMPLFKKQTIPLHDLSSMLKIDGEVIHEMDWRHWYYDDEVFENYLQKIVAVKPEWLCVFDMPFDYERPWKIEPGSFFMSKTQSHSGLTATIFCR